jgi:hypothetical protein
LKKPGVNAKASGSNISVNQSVSRTNLSSICEADTKKASKLQPSRSNSELNVLKSEESSMSADTPPPSLEVTEASAKLPSTETDQKKKLPLLKKQSHKWNELAKRRSHKEVVLDESTIMERSGTWGARRKISRPINTNQNSRLILSRCFAFL